MSRHNSEEILAVTWQQGVPLEASAVGRYRDHW
jgi:hypothetical protein